MKKDSPENTATPSPGGVEKMDRREFFGKMVLPTIGILGLSLGLSGKAFAASCVNTCTGGCALSCSGGCQGDCYKTCRDICANSCTVGCSSNSK